MAQRKRTGKQTEEAKAAEKMIDQQKQEQVALVDAAAQLQTKRNELTEALRQAENDYVAAYQAALEGGWSKPQLTQLNLQPPTKPRRTPTPKKVVLDPTESSSRI